MSSPLESLIQSASMITTPARTTNSDYFGFGFDSPFATDIKEWDGRIVDVDESTDRPIRRGEPNSSRMDKFLLNKFAIAKKTQNKFNIENDNYDNVKNKFKKDKYYNRTVALITGESSKFKKK